MSFIKSLFFINRLVAHLENFLLTIMLLSMLFLAFIQVILRDFFDSGLGWSDVLVRYMVLWIGFMGASLATKDDRHLRIDAFNKILPPKLIPFVEMFISFSCIVVGSFLTHAAYEFVLSEQMGGKALFGGSFQAWYLLTIMPIGFGMITFRYVLRLMEHVIHLAGKKGDLDKAMSPHELDISLKINVK